MTLCVFVCLFAKAGNSVETVATRERGAMSETMNERRMQMERKIVGERERRNEAGSLEEGEREKDAL